MSEISAMDLDFSFTLRTSIRPTVEKKLKTQPVSRQNKRVLSSTRRKHWQGVFINNDIDLQSKKKSEKFIKSKKSPAKQLTEFFSAEVKENLDPSSFVMNTEEKLSILKNKKSNTSSIANHDSSGEKDFIELGKISLRKHQRTLYKRNIKDGKLFYKRNVISNFTEFIEKSFATNNCADNRKLSDEVVENGLRISEKCRVDDNALHLDDDEDENDLFGGSILSTSSRLEKQAKKVGEKSVLELSEGKPSNGLDQSLIISSPSLLNSSLLGCRPLSNGKKRSRDISSPMCAPKPKKRSTDDGDKSSTNTSESIHFENLKTKVKSIMNSSSSLCEDFSPSPKPLQTSSDSFIDCISASDSDEPDKSVPKISFSSTNETRKLRNSSKTLINGNGIHSSNTSTKRKSLINGNGVHSSSTSTRRKSFRNRCVENGDESKDGFEHSVASESNKIRFETEDTTRCDRLNDFHDKVSNNSLINKEILDLSEVKSQISTRSTRRRSFKHVSDPPELSNNLPKVNESYASVDIFDDSRLSEVWGSTIDISNPDNVEDRRKSTRSRRSVKMNGDYCNVGKSLNVSNGSMSNCIRGMNDCEMGKSLQNGNLSVSDNVRGRKYNGVGLSSENSFSDRTGETKYTDCLNSSGDLLGFCSATSKTSERMPTVKKSCDSIRKKHAKKDSDNLSKNSETDEIVGKSCDNVRKKHAKKDADNLSKNSEIHEIAEKSCDNVRKNPVKKDFDNQFTRPKTPRRKSSRLSGVKNLCKDESWVSRDMFESDIEDERPKSRLNYTKEVVDNDVVKESDSFSDKFHYGICESVKIRKDRTSLSPGKSYADTPPRKTKGKSCKESSSPVKNSPEVHYNISESVKTRKDRKSLTPLKSESKPPRKSREKNERDPNYVTPSLPRTKLLEITKWLTDSEKSIRQGGVTRDMPPPVIEEPVEEIVISDDCSEGGDRLKTPPKTKTDKHRATDKQKTRNRTKTDKRSKKVKEEPLDKDEASSRVKTISSSENKNFDDVDQPRPAAANVGMYTEPKKPKKKKVDLVHPSFTEKKPTKTSMFSSSSSSEDLFEKFLEDEKKKRLSRLKKLERFEKLSQERFIYDGSSDEDNEIAFYRDFISSEIKKDAECMSEGKWSNHSAGSSHSRHVHPRRLSFESQGSGSDRATINNRISKKSRTKPKKRTPDKISKKHLPFRISPKHFLGSNKKNKKSAKKTTNSVKKTHEDKVIEQIKRINDNKKLEPNTPSTEKSSTKKVPKTPLTAQKLTGDLVTATPSSAKLRKELFSKTPAKTLSFLSSLSVLDDEDRCHPDAVQYKNSFKKLKQELTKKLFVLYNREVFKNRLPEDLPIEWSSRMISTSGYCFNKRTIRGGEVTRSARIQLSNKILDSADRLRDTLIHEMCHAATWLLDGVKDAHGPTWKNWTLEAMRRFPELPRIKVCHDYKIKTKYSYKCLGCGYSVGRHSKSLDIEHKRCGYCYGKFELLVNVKETANKKRSDKESDTATSTSTTRALRAPTGFAIFVKENYAKTKQENGNLVHKDVMKLLSEKFAQVKLSKAIKEDDDDVIFVESCKAMKEKSEVMFVES